MNEVNPLALVTPEQSKQLVTMARGIAGAVKDIVKKTAVKIQERDYVRVEGWQAIANAFNCVAAARDVKKVYDEASGEFLGFSAVGEVRRLTDGMIISHAEGFVGCDEQRWFGGEKEVWNKETRKHEKRWFPPSPEYSVRAMAQTRAISRACRSAFAFIVTIIDQKMSTTPAEEVPGATDEGPDASRPAKTVTLSEPGTVDGEVMRWEDYKCSYGKKGGPLRDKQLGELTTANLRFLYNKFVKSLNEKQTAELSADDKKMAEGLKMWEQAHPEPSQEAA